jgi:hypothetical protein
MPATPVAQAIKTILTNDSGVSSTSAQIAPQYFEGELGNGPLIVYETSENVKRTLSGDVTRLKFLNIKLTSIAATELTVRTVADAARQAICSASSASGLTIRSCRPLDNADTGNESVSPLEDDGQTIGYQVEENFLMQAFNS